MKRIFLILLSSVVLMIAFTLPFSADVFEGEENTLYRISTSDILATHSNWTSVPYFLPASSFNCVYVKTSEGTEFNGDFLVSLDSDTTSFPASQWSCIVSDSGGVIASGVKLVTVYLSSPSSVNIRPWYVPGGTIASSSPFSPISFTVVSEDSLLDAVSSFGFSILDVWGDVVAFVVDPDHLIVLLPVVAWLFVCGCGVFKNIPM